MSTSDALRELEARFAAGDMTRAEYSTHRRALLMPAAESSPDRPDPEPTDPQVEEPNYAPDPGAADWYPPPPWASGTGQVRHEPARSATAPTVDAGPDTFEPAAGPGAPPGSESSRDAGGVAAAEAPPGVAYERQPPAWASSGSDPWLPLADTWVGAGEEPEPPPPAPPPPAVAAPPPAVAAPPPPPRETAAAPPPADSAPDATSEPILGDAPTPARNAPAALDFSSRVGPSAAPDASAEPSPGTGPRRRAADSGGAGVRRAWIAVLALVVLVAAGILVWRLTSGGGSSTASATSPSVAGSVGPSPSIGSTRPASPTPTPPLRADAQHPFGILPSTALSAAGSGPATLAQATARNVIYPEEVTRLSACGATSGSTEVIVGQGWSLSGTVFTCRDAASATAVVGRLSVFEQALRFTSVTIGDTRVKAFFSTRNPPTPGYPAQFHIRYTSGAHVIGLVIQAKSERIGRQAANEVVAGAATFYPPTL